MGARSYDIMVMAIGSLEKVYDPEQTTIFVS